MSSSPENKGNLPFRKIHIIINPAAGKDEPILNVLNRVFYDHDLDWDFSMTRQKGDGTRFARQAVENGFDLVAGYGGDGTQMEVANGLIGTDVPMAILPGGTGNSMAFALNVPGNLQGAAELITSSSNVRGIDIAEIEGQYFMLRANTGTKEEQKASREEKDKYGNLAYIVEGSRLIKGLKTVKYQLTVDEEQIEAEGISCIVFNAGSIGHFGTFGKAIQVDDGLLDIFLVTKKFESALSLASYALDRQNELAGLYRRQGRQITVEADPVQPVWIDGEPFGQTPFTVRALHKALKVLVP